MIKVGSDFSGVGAFDQALIRLGINYETIFSCDMDKYARQTYIENYGEPKYFPENVYDREIPKESLDIYMTSPPCQAFSLAGSRKGESEERGILFYNSHKFILENKPRFFIFENVKGILSDDNGRTFQRWIDYLAKSVNGQPVIFPHEESANYHVYHQVLNSKDYGVPQNRERIFIIGIRDDKDNNFTFPPKKHLTKRLKDMLENDVDEKYFLSNDKINKLLKAEDANLIQCVGNTHPSGNGMNGNVYSDKGISPTLSTNKGEGIKIKSATKRGYEEAVIGDSINFQNLDSKTRRGRVGKGVAQTIDTSCSQAVIQDCIRRLTPRECFRLQDFPDSFKMPCSDSQMYKQAGNSITVAVLEKIINRLPL